MKLGKVKSGGTDSFSRFYGRAADIPIIVASVDPCMSCTDRVSFINGSKDTMTKEELHRLSVEKTRRMM